MIKAEELHKRQKWTLEQKIDHSLGAIEQFYNYTNGKIVVMFSGGKDSTVLLHLVRKIYPNVKAVFVNTTNEYTEILQFVKSINNIITIKPKKTFLNTIREYGFPIVSKKVAKAIGYIKYPSDKTKNVRNLVLTGINSKGESCKSFKLAKKWHFLKDEKFDITSKCCDILKHKPFKEFQKKNKLFPITGIMADEGQQRKGNYMKYGCNIMNGKNSVSRPLSIWNESDIWNYIHKYNVPYSTIYDDLKDEQGSIICKGEKRTGCAFCSFGLHLEKPDELNMRRFDRLKVREPKRYLQQMKLTNNGVTYNEAINIILTKQKKKNRKDDSQGQLFNQY